MRRRLFALTCTAFIALAGAACGGDGNGDALPSPTPDQFDPRVLTALVLQPDDVSLPPAQAVWNPEASNGISFQSAFGDPSLYVQSSVARMNSRGIFEEQSVRLRRALAGIIGPESNYDVEGADRGYIYRGVDPPQLMAAVFLREFIVVISLQSPDGTRPEAAQDEAQLGRYAETVVRRLEAFINDPDSVTPVPVFLTAAPAPPTEATPTPVSEQTPAATMPAEATP